MAIIKNEAGTHSLAIEADGSLNVNLTANGGATAAKQDVGNASLSSIDTKLSGTLSVNVVNQIDLTTITSHLLAIKNSVAAIDANTDTLEQKLLDTVSAINSNGSVNHADLALLLTQLQGINANTDGQEALLTSILAKIIASPATLSEQQTQTTSLSSIDSKLGGTLAVNVGLTDSQLRASAVPVSVSGVATAANQTTGNSSLSSIDGKTATLVGGKVPVVLPTNAATDTLQTSGNASLSSIDGKLSGTLSVNVGLTDAQLRTTAVPVSVSGVSTSALQTTGNTSLSNIDTKTPTLVTGRVPVDGSGVTQPVSFTRLASGTDSVTTVPSGTQTVSGTVIANAGTGNFTVVQTTAANLNATVTGTVAATQSGVWNVTNVSGTVSLPTGASTATLQTTGNSSLSSIDSKITAVNTGAVVVSSSALPTGASTSALQTTGNTTLSAIDTKLGNPLTVNVGLTDTQLRASAVPVSVSGVATAANQATGNASLTSIDTKTPTLVSGRQPVDGSGVTQPIVSVDGVATGSIAANGSSVVISISGQSSYAVQITGTWVGSLQFEGSVDGTNYTPLVVRLAGTSTFIISASSNAIYRGNCAAYKNVRVISTAWTSGTASIAIAANMAVGGVFINSEVRPKSSDLLVTNTGAAAAAVTLTLPAAGAGLFHYITKLEVSAIASAARTAAATPVIVTTTNLSGSLAFSFQANAAAQGVSERQVNDFESPLKSSVANTATTIVAPATTSVIWRVTAYYYTGA
jgi:hypothetical protein